MKNSIPYANKFFFLIKICDFAETLATVHSKVTDAIFEPDDCELRRLVKACRDEYFLFNAARLRSELARFFNNRSADLYDKACDAVVDYLNKIEASPDRVDEKGDGSQEETKKASLEQLKVFYSDHGAPEDESSVVEAEYEMLLAIKRSVDRVDEKGDGSQEETKKALLEQLKVFCSDHGAPEDESMLREVKNKTWFAINRLEDRVDEKGDRSREEERKAWLKESEVFYSEHRAPENESMLAEVQNKTWFAINRLVDRPALLEELNLHVTNFIANVPDIVAAGFRLAEALLSVEKKSVSVSYDNHQHSVRQQIISNFKTLEAAFTHEDSLALPKVLNSATAGQVLEDLKKHVHDHAVSVSSIAEEDRSEPMTKQEAANMLDISRGTLQTRIATGRVKYIKGSRQRHIFDISQFPTDAQSKLKSKKP